MAIGNLAARMVSKHSDIYGRFTSQTNIGQGGHKLTSISGYRVCKNQAGRPILSLCTAASHAGHRQKACSTKELFIDDMIECIKSCQLQGHEIILCFDANKTLHKVSSGIHYLITSCSLINVHNHLHPAAIAPTHQNGKDRIDYVLVSPRVLASVT